VVVKYVDPLAGQASIRRVGKRVIFSESAILVWHRP
jgi:hypothetical protein